MELKKIYQEITAIDAEIKKMYAASNEDAAYVLTELRAELCEMAASLESE